MIDFANRTSGGGGTDVTNELLVIAEHIATAEEAIKSLYAGLDQLGDARARSLTLDTLFQVCGRDFFTSGSGAPTVAGVCKFAEYHDTANNKFYKYNGSSWVLLN